MAGDFCSACGTKFTEAGWPRKCSCGNVAYRNPIPVAVGLVPVYDEADVAAGVVRHGLLVVKRGIPPGIGQLALPGGYMEMGESWEHAVAREVFEETGRQVSENIVPFDIRTSPRGLLLIFGLTTPIKHGTWLLLFKPNSEVQALDVIWAPTDLAFPLHTEAANRFFNTKGRVFW